MMDKHPEAFRITYLTWGSCTPWSCARCSGSLVTYPGWLAWAHIFAWWYDSSKSLFLPLETTLDDHRSTICVNILKVSEGFQKLCVFFFFSYLCTSPVDYKPWGQLMHHFRSGADSSRQHCPTHLEDVHISPISFQVLWSVSGASPSNSAHSAFYPLYYSSVLTHKTFQTLEMVQCIMVFKNIQYLCLNEKNKYLGSFCTCQQYSVKQYV